MNRDTRLPDLRPSRAAEKRRWKRFVDRLDDDELMLVVRSRTAVDRAVDSYRKKAA